MMHISTKYKYADRLKMAGPNGNIRNAFCIRYKNYVKGVFYCEESLHIWEGCLRVSV